MQTKRKQALAAQLLAKSSQATTKAPSATADPDPKHNTEVEHDGSFEDDVEMSNEDPIYRVDLDVALPKSKSQPQRRSPLLQPQSPI